jgi:hypothetical protein
VILGNFSSGVVQGIFRTAKKISEKIFEKMFVKIFKKNTEKFSLQKIFLKNFPGTPRDIFFRQRPIKKRSQTAGPIQSTEARAGRKYIEN